MLKQYIRSQEVTLSVDSFSCHDGERYLCSHSFRHVRSFSLPRDAEIQRGGTGSGNNPGMYRYFVHMRFVTMKASTVLMQQSVQYIHKYVLRWI